MTNVPKRRTALRPLPGLQVCRASRGGANPSFSTRPQNHGTITDQSITLLGPDLRESGDGRELGLAKVIAGLIGVSTDDVFRRTERDRRRRNMMRASLAGLFLMLAIGATAGAGHWWYRFKTDDAFSSAALRRITESMS